MTKIVALQPAEELTRHMVDAALAESRRVMIERDITEFGVTFEFMSHAIDRLWEDDDLEGLRAKAHALADNYIDRLFDGIGEYRKQVSR